MTAKPIPINAIWTLPKDKSIDDVPINRNPFYVAAKEGIFLRQTGALGTSTLKASAMPASLGELGYDKGVFTWNAPRVPAELCAQIVHFFRRIWDKQKTEAEVLLTARYEVVDGIPKITEWRVFVPTQTVSGGGVNSVYEPTHIARGHLIVGTMHSHCNFSAFHSGIDTNDASGFDGLHLTIGFIDRKEPQIVSMIMINGVKIDFKPEVVADFSNLEAATAPAWWDNYVTPTSGSKNKAVGHEIFERYPRSFGGTYKPSEHSYGPPYGGQGWGNGSHSSFDGMWGNRPPLWTPRSKTLKEIEEEQDRKLLPADTKSLSRSQDSKKDDDDIREGGWYDLFRQAEANYWEDTLGIKIRDLLFDQLLMDKDVDDLTEIADDNKALSFIQQVLFKKLAAIKKILEAFGIKIIIQIDNTKGVGNGNRINSSKRSKTSNRQVQRARR